MTGVQTCALPISAFEHLRKPGAAVINVSAPQAFMPTALQAHVCAAKSGVDMVTRVLAIEWGPAGVRVNAISPGPVEGTEGMRRLTPSEEAKARLEGTIPVGRYATPAEIADVAFFLATPAASYVSGAVLVCDGDGRPLARVTGAQASSRLGSLEDADLLLEVPAEAADLPAGTLLWAQLLRPALF